MVIRPSSINHLRQFPHKSNISPLTIEPTFRRKITHMEVYIVKFGFQVWELDLGELIFVDEHNLPHWLVEITYSSQNAIQ